MKSGDARVALIGFPSVGKSTLLNKLTNTHSEACAYEFTTLTCIPGKIEYNGANIQLLDLPGIIEGAAQGKGRGRQVMRRITFGRGQDTGYDDGTSTYSFTDTCPCIFMDENRLSLSPEQQI